MKQFLGIRLSEHGQVLTCLYEINEAHELPLTAGGETESGTEIGEVLEEVAENVERDEVTETTELQEFTEFTEHVEEIDTTKVAESANAYDHLLLDIGRGLMVQTEHGPSFGRVVWTLPSPGGTASPETMERLLSMRPAVGEEPAKAKRSEGEDDNLSCIYEARVATAEESCVAAENEQLARQAHYYCRKCIAERNLDMKLVDVEVVHDHSKMLFYFTAPTRIDFRELVKDLVRQYRTRIELRQIGVRHETQMVGAVGNCGMVCCCRRYLRKFAPVTIKMAKEQNLFLNPAKISGICGRLLCCLSYEQDNYDAFHRSCPKLGKRYQTDIGPLRVLRANIFRNSIIALPDSDPERELTLEEWANLNPHRPESAPSPKGTKLPQDQLMTVSASLDTLDSLYEPAGETELADLADESPSPARKKTPKPKNPQKNTTPGREPGLQEKS